MLQQSTSRLMANMITPTNIRNNHPQTTKNIQSNIASEEKNSNGMKLKE
jgi:hypothetical protein